MECRGICREIFPVQLEERRRRVPVYKEGAVDQLEERRRRDFKTTPFPSTTELCFCYEQVELIILESHVSLPYWPV